MSGSSASGINSPLSKLRRSPRLNQVDLKNITFRSKKRKDTDHPRVAKENLIISDSENTFFDDNYDIDFQMLSMHLGTEDFSKSHKNQSKIALESLKKVKGVGSGKSSGQKFSSNDISKLDVISSLPRGTSSSKINPLKTNGQYSVYDDNADCSTSRNDYQSKKKCRDVSLQSCEPIKQCSKCQKLVKIIAADVHCNPDEGAIPPENNSFNNSLSEFSITNCSSSFQPPYSSTRVYKTPVCR